MNQPKFPPRARSRFTPTPGTAYRNLGGGVFRCIRADGFLEEGEAVMQNTASGWTFTAHGIGIYKNGYIDWDYSTGGRFERWLPV